MMSQIRKHGLRAEVRPRNSLGNRNAKQRILDDLVAITGHRRV